MSSSSAAAGNASSVPSCVLVDLHLTRREHVRSRLEHSCEVAAVATVTDALEQSGCAGMLVVHDPPGTDVVHAARVARSGSRIPIIAMCPRPVDCETTLRMFAAGVDDVVMVDVDPRELIARLGAVTRRNPARAAASTAPGASLTVGALNLDLESHTVTVDGVERRLTNKEFEVLMVLARARGRTVRRGDIARRVWRRDPLGLDHTIDSHIASLRTKLGLRSLIATVRGVGYRVDDEQEPRS